MNKKFKLTDKVTKESIRSPEFKRWLMRTLAVVCIFSLIFQFSTCVYQGLSVYAAEEPTSDSVSGTYIINEVVDNSIVYDDLNTNPLNYILKFNGSLSGRSFTAFRPERSVNGVGNVFNYVECQFSSGGYTTCYFSPSGWYADYSSRILTVDQDIIFNYSNEDVTNLFAQWLTINTTKVIETVHDFTNEIRVFNDDLTFFITNSTTWTEAFNFNFEVIGVGTADYIVLQRDVNNNYTMSYSYDFEGSGGLRTVYRFNHTTDIGGFFKENTKHIRFISNPENTDFQQWLLDNTTLVGTSDDSEAFDTFYDMGFNVGYNAGYEQGFANSLIGDSLSGPINALSSITLIQIGDTVITLGGVIMTAIALSLVLAFLKLYAGG